MAVSYKTKYELTIQPNNCTFRHLSQRNKNLYSHEHTQMFIAALIFIAKNWKQSVCPSVGKWLNELGHPYHGILHSNKKEQTTNMCDNLCGSIPASGVHLHEFKSTLSPSSPVQPQWAYFTSFARDYSPANADNNST